MHPEGIDSNPNTRPPLRDPFHPFEVAEREVRHLERIEILEKTLREILAGVAFTSRGLERARRKALDVLGEVDG